MLEAQKKKEEEIDNQNTLTIDVAAGTAKLEQVENTFSGF